MLYISKQLVCQKYIFKIRSSRLRKEKWKLNLPLEEARKNDEIIALADSQILRWIDELNGIFDADNEAKKIKGEIKKLKKEPNCRQNSRTIRSLYSQLDRIQFKPDYMCLIIDREKEIYSKNINSIGKNKIILPTEELKIVQSYSLANG